MSAARDADAEIASAKALLCLFVRLLGEIWGRKRTWLTKIAVSGSSYQPSEGLVVTNHACINRARDGPSQSYTNRNVDLPTTEITQRIGCIKAAQTCWSD
jgi:hypothetical protein